MTSAQRKSLRKMVMWSVIFAMCALGLRSAFDWGHYNSEVSIRRYDNRGMMERIFRGLSAYSSDFDDCLLPVLPAVEWRRLLKSYNDDVYFESHNPEGGVIVPNNFVAGANLKTDLGSDTVLAFEEKVWRDDQKIYLFSDSSSKFLKSEEPKKMTVPSSQK